MLRVRKQVYCSDRYTGKDITVAVLDTGISRHPDFGSRILGFTDFVNGRVGLYDDDTHGTHVIVCKHNMEKYRTSLYWRCNEEAEGKRD